MPASMVTTQAQLLFLHAQTSLHPGAGTALGVIDLPVQRERHTQWPMIPASSIKGVLRDACRRQGGNGEDWKTVFGPEGGSSSEHAGALAVTDARLLAFPVRSLRGVFSWVTCPAALDRLRRDLTLAGMDNKIIGELPEVEPNQVACAEKSPLLLAGNQKMVLEEYEFSRAEGADAQAVAGLGQWIAQCATTDPETQKRIASHLAVLNDNDFTHFARHATEVMARVGLDYQTKTVKDGALFYQEFVPPETIFYSVLLAENSRNKKSEMKAEEVAQYIREILPAVLQVGGDETTGKGLCAVNFVKREEA